MTDLGYLQGTYCKETWSMIGDGCSSMMNMTCDGNKESRIDAGCSDENMTCSYCVQMNSTVTDSCSSDKESSWEIDEENNLESIVALE